MEVLVSDIETHFINDALILAINPQQQTIKREMCWCHVPISFKYEETICHNVDDLEFHYLKPKNENRYYINAPASNILNTEIFGPCIVLSRSRDVTSEEIKARIKKGGNV